jgi:hypothetical protein
MLLDSGWKEGRKGTGYPDETYQNVRRRMTAIMSETSRYWLMPLSFIPWQQK